MRAVEEAEEDGEVKVLVIKGAGRAFSAGDDIKEQATRTASKELYHQKLCNILQNNRIDTLEKPVIAQIHGYCLGGGLELALACDIRICSEDARLGLPEINLGGYPGDGGVQRLPRLVGKAMAKELMFTGKHIDGREAERIGLVNHAVAADKLEETVNELAKTIASKMPPTIRVIKRLVNSGMGMPLLESIEYSMAMRRRLAVESELHKEEYKKQTIAVEAYKERFTKKG